MPHVSVTWGNGTVSQENILTEVVSEATSDDRYEFIVWDNGDLTIESPEYQFTGDDTLPHIRIPVNAVMKLVEFLGRERIAEILNAYI